MGRPKAIHTLETVLARTIEVGECLEWQGIVHNGSPVIRIDRRLLTVRRVIREFEGCPARPQNFLFAKCGNPLCVRPEHIRERTRAEHIKLMAANVDYGNPLRIARLQQSKQHARRLDEEGVARIRCDARRAQDLADELGVSKSLVNAIRRGVSHRQVSAAANPFVGLMR